MSNVVKSISNDVAVVLFEKMNELHNEFYAEQHKAEEWDSHDVCWAIAADAYKLYENGYNMLKYNVGEFDSVLYSIYLVQGGIDECYAEHIENVVDEDILQKDDYIAIANLLVSLFSK